MTMSNGELFHLILFDLLVIVSAYAGVVYAVVTKKLQKNV